MTGIANVQIDISVIPHDQQRYDSTGDWYWTQNILRVRVSKLSDPRWEFCLGLHEMIEAMLCHFMGISQEDVDAFDMPYESAHQRNCVCYPCGCPRQRLSDPGSDKHAPYAFQHKIADAAERVVAAVLGIHWASYDEEVSNPPR
jgi:hypothetical protein